MRPSFEGSKGWFEQPLSRRTCRERTWARRLAEDRCFRKAEAGGSNPPVSIPLGANNRHHMPAVMLAWRPERARERSSAARPRA